MNNQCVKILRVLRLSMLPVDIMHEQTVCILRVLRLSMLPVDIMHEQTVCQNLTFAETQYVTSGHNA